MYLANPGDESIGFRTSIIRTAWTHQMLGHSDLPWLQQELSSIVERYRSWPKPNDYLSTLAINLIQAMLQEDLELAPTVVLLAARIDHLRSSLGIPHQVGCARSFGVIRSVLLAIIESPQTAAVHAVQQVLCAMKEAPTAHQETFKRAVNDFGRESHNAEAFSLLMQ